MGYDTKIIDFEINQCPLCKHAHRYKLKIFTKEKQENKVVLFGGAEKQTEVMFQCPETDRNFTFTVASEDFEVAGVATQEDIDKYETTQKTPSPPALQSELADWIKSSRTIALDFCKGMLSTAIGAIPIYFAIIKYLGSEKLSKPSDSYLLLPAVLFLISAVAYVLALKPRFDSITEKEFAEFKKNRLGQLNRYLVAGTVFFITGITCSIIIFLKLL